MRLYAASRRFLPAACPALLRRGRGFGFPLPLAVDVSELRIFGGAVLISRVLEELQYSTVSV